MEYLFLLLVYQLSDVVTGKLYWNVSEKVTNYRQTVTLLCVSDSCNSATNCQSRAGWDRYNDPSTLIPTYVVVRQPQNSNISKKYSGRFVEKGFTLEIRNLSEADLNIYYECSVGVKRSQRKQLLKEDVFTTQQDSSTEGLCDCSSRTHVITYVVLAIAIVIVLFLIVAFICWKRNKSHNSERNRGKENYNEENQPSMENVTELPLSSVRDESTANHENELMNKNNSLQKELEEAQDELQNARASIDEMNQEIKNLQWTITSLRAENKELKDFWQNARKESKEYYKQLIDCKGKIMVFCRVRPPASVNHNVVINYDENTTPYVVNVTNKDERHKFKVDQIFTDKKTQDDVFQELKDSVSSCLDGCNVCLLAYGQSGSGKTFTLEGETGNKGIRQRALERLFSGVESRKVEWTFNVTVSMLEIYDENIKDLIDPKTKVKIKYKKGVYVKDINLEKVNTLEDANKVYSKALKNRSSSMSHVVLYVTIEGRHTEKSRKLTTKGELVLIDLAGSDVMGSEQWENSNINKSMKAFKGVIKALGSGKECPAPDSQLTSLLQNYLGKDKGTTGKVLMIVTVSPDDKHADETIKNLQFAQQVGEVYLGPASRNRNT